MRQLPWQEFLNGPAYVINLDRRPERWQSSCEQLQRAGFRRTRRWSAFDGSQGDAAGQLQQFGIGKLVDIERFLELPGAQGCAVSELRLLQHIIAKGYPFAHVFEDDIRFSSQWHQLAPAYLKATPKSFGLLYMGSQINYKALPAWHPAKRLFRSRRLTRLSRQAWPWPSRALGDVLQRPLYCLHAITITRQGCIALLNYLLNQPIGFYLPDCMIHDGMARETRVSTFPLNWYAWNAHRFVTGDSERGSNRHWIVRNCGLVHQEEAFGTDIQPR